MALVKKTGSFRVGKSNFVTGLRAIESKANNCGQYMNAPIKWNLSFTGDGSKKKETDDRLGALHKWGVRFKTITRAIYGSDSNIRRRR